MLWFDQPSIKVRTKSELVFEHYCREHCYRTERIEPEANAGRSPDYRVITPAGRVIVEIKEFTPNEDDKQFVEGLKKLGHAAYQRTLGKRVRKAIQDAASQLRRYKATLFPEVLLLYDNIYDNPKLDGDWPFARNEYLEPLAIKAAMFGSPQLRFTLDCNKTAIDPTGSSHGGGRQLTETQRLYIGAVAVLTETIATRSFQIDFFHNFFSTIPVFPKYFQHPSDRHFVKSDHPERTGWGWAEFVGDRQTT